MNIAIAIDVEAGKENRENGGVWGKGKRFAEQTVQHNMWPP